MKKTNSSAPTINNPGLVKINIRCENILALHTSPTVSLMHVLPLAKMMFSCSYNELKPNQRWESGKMNQEDFVVLNFFCKCCESLMVKEKAVNSWSKRTKFVRILQNVSDVGKKNFKGYNLAVKVVPKYYVASTAACFTSASWASLLNWFLFAPISQLRSEIYKHWTCD